jgi:hypothetical protein
MLFVLIRPSLREPLLAMHFKTALLSLAAVAAAKEVSKDEIKANKLYDSGIRHANNVALKRVGVPHCCIPRELGTDIVPGNLEQAEGSRRIRELSISGPRIHRMHQRHGYRRAGHVPV